MEASSSHFCQPSKTKWYRLLPKHNKSLQHPHSHQKPQQERFNYIPKSCQREVELIHHKHFESHTVLPYERIQTQKGSGRQYTTTVPSFCARAAPQDLPTAAPAASPVHPLRCQRQNLPELHLRWQRQLTASIQGPREATHLRNLPSLTSKAPSNRCRSRPSRHRIGP
jgi:hypothetical protein